MLQQKALKATLAPVELDGADGKFIGLDRQPTSFNPKCLASDVITFPEPKL